MEDTRKVKVRMKGEGGPPTQQKRLSLLAILRRKNINLLRLIDLRDGWVIVAQSARDVQAVQQAKDEIQHLQMELTLPMELLNQYQLVVKKLDPTVFDHNEEEIINEIYRTEPFTRDQIENIYLMKQHGIIKMKFKNIMVATRIKTDGLKMFGWICKIIENERSNKVKQCFRCYSYEHSTTDCEATGTLCSECSSTDHLWKDCPRDTLKCTQCNGNHRTFSATCKIRKERLIEEEKARKRKEEENRQQLRPITEALKLNNKTTENTFANVVRRNNEESRIVTGAMIKETNKETNKIMKDMIAAAVKEEMKNIYSDIERMIERKLDAVVEKLRTAIIQATRPDEGATTPKEDTTTTDYEDAQTGAIRKRKILKKKREKGQETPHKRPTKGRFSLYKDHPIIAFPDEEIMEENETDIQQTNKEDKEKETKRSQLYDTVGADNILRGLDLEETSLLWDNACEITASTPIEKSIEDLENTRRKQEEEVQLALAKENRREADLAIVEHLKRHTETAEEDLQTFCTVKELVKNDLKALEEELKNFEKNAITNEKEERAYLEDIKTYPELYDQDGIKKRTEAYKRYKSTQNEIINRLKEAVRRKTRTKELFSMPW